MTAENAIRLSPSGPYTANVMRSVARTSASPPNTHLLAGADVTIPLLADSGAEAAVANLTAALVIQETSGAPNSVLVEWIIGGAGIASPLLQDLTASKASAIAYPAIVLLSPHQSISLRVTAGAGGLTLEPNGLICAQLTAS